MELDELKQKWAEHDRKLDTSIRLNRQVVRELYTGRARSALVRLAAIIGLGSVTTLAVIMWLGRFVYDHRTMPRFVLPAAALDVLAIAALATAIRQIALALQTDYGQPVATIQRRLEKLRMARIRYVEAILIASPLLWIPMFIVAMEAIWGIDVYATFDLKWLVGNVLFGLAFIPVGIWLARRYGRKIEGSLAGYNLQAASEFIATLADFERE